MNGTLSYDELVEETHSKTTYEKTVVRAVIDEYMAAVKRNTLKGFRCPLGENFLVVYPNISASVKDELNQDGSVKTVATADMLSARGAKSRLGCTVAIKFSRQFAEEVSWQKVDPITGIAATEEEDVTQGNENVETGDDNTQIGDNTGTVTPSNGGSTGNTGGNTGGDNDEPGGDDH